MPFYRKTPLVILSFLLACLCWYLFSSHYIFGLMYLAHNGRAVKANMIESLLIVVPIAVLFYILYSKNIKLVKSNETAYLKMFWENPYPMWIYSRKSFRFLEVNEAAIKKYGYTRQEFLSMKVFDIRPEEDIPKFIEVSRQHPQGYAEPGIWRHYTKEKKLLYVNAQSYVTVYQDQEAEIVGLWDITQQQLYKKQLDQKQKLLQALVNSTDDLIWAVDENMNYLIYNDAFYDIFHRKYKLNIGIGQSSKINLFGEAAQQKRTEDLQSALTGKQLRLVEKFTLPDMNEIHIETALHPIVSDEKVIGVACFAKNITDRKLNEIKLKDSLERYDLLAKTTREAIWDLDLQSGLIYWNHGLLNHFGYDRTETTAAWRQQLVCDPDKSVIQQSLQDAIDRQQERWEHQYHVACADGSVKLVNDKAYIKYDEEGKALRIIGAMADIQQQQEYENKIRTLSQAASKTNTALLITDKNGKVQWCNNSFENITSYTIDEVIGRRAGDVLSGPDSSPHIIEKIRQKMAEEQSAEADILQYKKNGQRFWARLSITPLYADNGEFMNFITVIDDITDLKNHLSKIEHQNKLLMQIADLSAHELRGPLSSILSIHQFIKDTNAPAKEQISFLSDIWNKIQDLDEVIHGIIYKCNEVEHQLDISLERNQVDQ